MLHVDDAGDHGDIMVEIHGRQYSCLAMIFCLLRHLLPHNLSGLNDER